MPSKEDLQKQLDDLNEQYKIKVTKELRQRITEIKTKLGEQNG